MLKNKNSLYRLYRPKTFTEVAGHTNIVNILRNEVLNNAFSHAMLLTGQRGTGKTSLARIFAKTINCQQLDKNANSCEKCQNCLLNNQNQASNVFEIDAASNNGIDEIRSIKESAATLPLIGLYKVYIIDEVHMLSKAAFNALLKILEEPPTHVVFILATTEFIKIPQTVVSRCQTFNLRKISKPDLKNHLLYIANQEGFVLNEQVNEELYFLSEGSLRDALTMLEQLFVISENKQITIETLQKIFYVPSKRDKLQLLQDVENGRTEAVIIFFNQARDLGLDFNVFVLSIIDIFKEIIECKLTNDEQFLKNLTVEEFQYFNRDLDYYFLVADSLNELYQKANVSVNNYAVLASFLKITVANKNAHTNQGPVGVAAPPLISDAVSPTPETTAVLNTQKADIDADPVSEMKLFQNEKLTQLVNFNVGELKSYELPNNDALNLMVNSNKNLLVERTQIIQTWFSYENHQFVHRDQAYKFIAWFEGKIVATSDCEVLILFDDETSANFLKKSLLDASYRGVLADYFQADLTFYVVEKKQWEVLKKEYLFRRKTQNLPTHIHQTSANYYRLLTDKLAQDSQKSPQFTEQMRDLFGDKIRLEE